MYPKKENHKTNTKAISQVCDRLTDVSDQVKLM